MTHDTPSLPDGLTWRAPKTTDAAGLAAHTRLIHEAERLGFLPNAEFFAWLLDQPGIDVDHDVRVGVDADRIVADCGTWLHTADTGSRCIIWAETTPGWEHVRPAMVEWATARARQRLQDRPGPRVIRASVEEHRTDLRQTYSDAGFDAARSFVDMARPLTDLPDPPPLPHGIEVVGWSTEYAESARLTSNAAFADHWGSLPMSREEWRGFTDESPTFRSDLSFVAVDGEQVISFSLAEVDEDDNAERDTNDLYIHRVGTLPEFRGRGIASHLMVRSMQAAAAPGTLDRAALDVDESSHTNATRVYERLGFEVYDRSITYVVELPPAG